MPCSSNSTTAAFVCITTINFIASSTDFYMIDQHIELQNGELEEHMSGAVVKIH